MWKDEECRSQCVAGEGGNIHAIDGYCALAHGNHAEQRHDQGGFTAAFGEYRPLYKAGIERSEYSTYLPERPHNPKVLPGSMTRETLFRAFLALDLELICRLASMPEF